MINCKLRIWLLNKRKLNRYFIGENQTIKEKMGWAQGHFTEIIALQRIIHLYVCVNITWVIYSQWHLPRIAVKCNKDIKILEIKILIEAFFWYVKTEISLVLGRKNMLIAELTNGILSQCLVLICRIKVSEKTRSESFSHWLMNICF